MKFSLAWLKELVEVDLPVAELARRLTMGGLEVEEIAPVAADFSGIVVAHVKSVRPHPDALSRHHRPHYCRPPSRRQSGRRPGG